MIKYQFTTDTWFWAPGERSWTPAERRTLGGNRYLVFGGAAEAASFDEIVAEARQLAPYINKFSDKAMALTIYNGVEYVTFPMSEFVDDDNLSDEAAVIAARYSVDNYGEGSYSILRAEIGNDYTSVARKPSAIKDERVAMQWFTERPKRVVGWVMMPNGLPDYVLLAVYPSELPDYNACPQCGQAFWGANGRFCSPLCETKYHIKEV